MSAEINSQKIQTKIEKPPLVVDLDGTLIHTDLLFEGFLALLKKNPFYIFLCFFWLINGKLILKQNIFARISLGYNLLPYNTDLLKFLNEEKPTREIVLATASLQECANEISKQIPLFSKVYGSTDKSNLKGKRKLQLLHEKFGKTGFDYIGDSKSDLPIFAESRKSYLVSSSKSLLSKVSAIGNLDKSWTNQKSTLFTYIKAIRVYQWLKNLLLFIPLITSHKIGSSDLVMIVVLSFLSFSFVASAGYIINDLMDLDADRAHPRKCFRPLASGNISIVQGIVIFLLLLGAGLVLAYWIKPLFFLVLISYFIGSMAYSVYLKKIVLYDVFLLAMFYSVRVISGGIVTDVQLSFWLIAFSAFIFLSLAFVKRYSEVVKVTNVESVKNRRRDYSENDIPLLQIMGIVSGFLSVVVFSLYINSQEVKLLYPNPKVLWIISLLLLFWVSRIWLITSRGKMTDDPIIFTSKDIGSYIIMLLTFITLLISKFFFN